MYSQQAFGVQIAPMIVVGVIFSALVLVFTPVVLVFGALLLPFLATQSAVLAPFREERFSACSAWQSATDQLNAVSDSAFERARAELQQAYQELSNIGSTRTQRIQKLQAEVSARQLQRFLEGHRIASAHIPNIGPGRKVTLESYGIETAYDVSEAVALSVPGFGPKLARRLADWRAEIERRFVFQPQLGVDSRDVAALDAEMKILQNKLETQLASGPARLETARMQLDMTRAALKKQVDAALTRLVQAEVDLNAASATGATKVAWGISGFWLVISIAWVTMLGGLVASLPTVEPSPPPPPPAFIAPVPAPSPTSQLAPPSSVRITRSCELWGFDASGLSIVIGQSSTGERYPVIAMDDQSVQIRLSDGGSAWIVRSCTDL